MRFLLHLALPLLAALPALAGPEQTRVPVPLFTPIPQTPDEAAGLDLVPEVSVQVRVDATGKVSAVDVLSVRPTSELDPAFTAATRDMLHHWRYAPALEDGKPVEARLEWIVHFSTVAERRNQSRAWWNARQEARDEGDVLRRHLLTLPVDMRVKLLEHNATIARKCFHGEPAKVQTFLSPRFVVYTDAPDPDTAAVLANNLEATFEALRGILGADLAPQPEPYRIMVFLYAQEDEYGELRRRAEALEWAVGFYSPLGLLAFHMQMPSNESLLATMLHEATHAYLDRYLVRPGVVSPRWLDEGFADYIGNSKIKKGHLVPGRTRNTEVYRFDQFAVWGRSTARFGVAEAKRALREGRAPSVERLVGADLSEFYGEDREMYYTFAWLLVHFLRHDQEEWAAGRFPELMLYVAEGYPPEKALREVYGDPVELDAPFRDYVKGF